MKDMLKNNFLKSISIALIAASAVQFVFVIIYFNTDLPDALYNLFLQNIADKTEDMRLIAQRFSMAIGYLLMVQSIAYLFMGIVGVRQRRLSIAINLSTLVLVFSLLIYMFLQTPDLIKILFEQVLFRRKRSKNNIFGRCQMANNHPICANCVLVAGNSLSSKRNTAM